MLVAFSTPPLVKMQQRYIKRSDAHEVEKIYKNVTCNVMCHQKPADEQRPSLWVKLELDSLEAVAEKREDKRDKTNANILKTNPNIDELMMN